MQARRMILTTLAVLAFVAQGWNGSSQLAADDTERGSATAQNPLRDPSVNRFGPSADGALTARSQILRQLQADLKGSDKGRAILAIHQLKEFGAPGAELLVQSLSEPNQPMEIQFPTLNALEKLGSAAVPALMRMLESADDSQHHHAWQLLDRLGPAAGAAVPKLLERVVDTQQESDDRAQAAYLLGRIGPVAQEALGPLLDVTEREEDDDLRMACVGAVRLIGGISEEHSHRLLKLLVNEDEERELRVAAAAVLADQPDPSEVVLPALIGLLQNHDDWNVCVSVAEALGKLGSNAADAAPALARLLEHETNDVRLAAVAALGAIGPAAREAVPSLVHCVQVDDGKDIPESAAQALVKIDIESVDAMISGLEGDGTAQENTLRALAAIGPLGRAAVPQLLKKLADTENPECHSAVIRVMRDIGPDATTAIPSLLSVLISETHPIDVRVEAVLALAAISPEPAPELYSTLRDPAPALRVAAAQALAMQDTRNRIAIPMLVRELADADAAESAAAALATVGDDAVPLLGQLALDQSADFEHRRQAILVLGRMSGAAVPILVQALSDNEEGIAGTAEQALFEIGPRLAEPALLAAIVQRTSQSASNEPGRQDAIVDRMLQLITDMSGGMGGFISEIGSGGSAAPAAAPPESATGAPPESAAPPPPSARTIQPKFGAAATGAAPSNASDASAPATPADREMDLKVVNVYYGTNRQPIESATERFGFLGRGFLPAMVMGAATMLVCGIGFARSRSPRLACLAAVGIVATICLAFPATQPSSESPRSIASRPGPVYGSEPNELLEVGMCQVTIPADHRPGELESPSILRLEFDQDPRKHIVVRDVTSYGLEQFHRAIKQDLAAKGNNILVFVHGYNVDFDDAARRTAQLACDLDFAGVPLFFSWPSQGNWYEYRQDEKQVELAVPLLKEFLLDVASRSEATSIHLIAHSMGNRALTAALKEIETTSESQATQFNQVVLAAPDIDAEVFRKRIAPAIVSTANRVTLYASSNDLALMASRTFNSGDLRAGDTSRGLVLTPGIETIDVSGADTSLLGHSYYGDSPTVLTDLKELLQSARPADQRPFLRATAVNHVRYWVFQPTGLAKKESTPTLSR